MSHPAPEKAAVTAELHPLLAARFSPRAFDAEPLDDDTVTRLVEAARWAPSASNLQPWRLVVTRPGEPVHDALVATMTGANPEWAPKAPLLILTLTELAREDGKPHQYGEYDTGAAMAHLTFQAAHDGLHVHQMAGFDKDAAYAAVGSPENLRPTSLVAVGRQAAASSLPEKLAERELQVRERRPHDEIVLPVQR